MIAYLNDRPFNTVPRSVPFNLSEFSEVVGSPLVVEVSLAVEDTDCEVYGLTSDGYIDYPFEYIVSENVDGSTDYTVLVSLTDKSDSVEVLNHLEDKDLELVQQAYSIVTLLW